MDEDALRDRIRRLLFASPALARAFAHGDFRSVFRGRGIEFDSLREYYPDDDARLIDWNATARLGEPFIRTYREDRSLTVFLLVDVSASMDQGSGELSKLDEAVLVSSLVAYAAQLRGLPVGCLLFAKGILASLPPQRGKSHALAVASAAAAYRSRMAAAPEPDRGTTDLALALSTIGLAQKRRSLVLVLSDFLASDWERPLAELSRRHDVVAVRLSDRLDVDPPRVGAFHTTDPETGEGAWLPFGSGKFRASWRAKGEARRRECLEAFARCQTSCLEIDTEDDPALKLLSFFERRRAR
jgi:uncharacterized protein (DUF58 family)